MVFGLGPMGCIPLQRVLSISGSGECQEKTNNLALSFNKAANNLLEDLSKNLPNASYRFGDGYDVVDNVIKNPSKYGASPYQKYKKGFIVHIHSLNSVHCIFDFCMCRIREL